MDGVDGQHIQVRAWGASSAGAKKPTGFDCDPDAGRSISVAIAAAVATDAVMNDLRFNTGLTRPTQIMSAGCC